LVVHHGLPLKKTHDLEELLDLLSPVETTIGDEHYNEAIKVKIYAVGIRYPGGFGDPSKSEVDYALKSAEFFQTFAKGILEI
jgi:HEPN domain-containing protein